MTCGVCGGADHNAKSCPTVMCESMLHEMIDQMFQISTFRDYPLRSHRGEMCKAVLMGTHDRLGESSPFQLLSGHTDLIEKILTINKHEYYDIMPSKDLTLEKATYHSHHRYVPEQYIPASHYNNAIYFLVNNSLIEEAVCDNMYSTVGINMKASSILWMHFIDKDTLITYNDERVIKYMEKVSYRSFDEGTIKSRYMVHDDIHLNNPTVYNNSILIPSRLSKTILRVEQCKTIWRTELDCPLRTSIYVNMLTKIGTVATNYKIYQFNPDSGSILSYVNFEFVQHYQLSCNENNITYCANSEGLSKIDIKRKSIAWQISKYTNVYHKPCEYKNKYVFIINNDSNVVCIDGSSKKTLWIAKLGSKITIPLTITEYYVYTGCNNKQVYKINPENGKIMWWFRCIGVPSHDIVCLDKGIGVITQSGTRTSVSFLKK